MTEWRPDAPEALLEEVADGVFAYVQHDGGWWVNTTGFIAGSSSVVAVDSCATYRRTRALLSVIAERTGCPVRTLVNTHFHGDHTHGNVLFDGAIVVGHELCRTAIQRDTLLAEPPRVFEPVPDWGPLRLRPPELTFTDTMTLWLDDREIQLDAVGRPAHTDADVLAWVPGPGVLFTGDLVFNGGTPMLLQGSVTGYLAALESVRAYDVTVLVPGHGRPCGPEVLDVLSRYARFVLDTAASARDAGLTPLEAAHGVDLGEFAGLLDPERIVLNLHRAYADLDGSPSADVPAAFADAVAWNGGRLLRCDV
ncbi:MAG TPA: MBL fold metallo-hydrolase [Streptosporangiaceae bacterium]|nr:MBL fold metallo-hydrolase [Streptosporangiaceae bacterium]